MTDTAWLIKYGEKYWTGGKDDQWSDVLTDARLYAMQGSAIRARSKIMRFHPELNSNLVTVQELP